MSIAGDMQRADEMSRKRLDIRPESQIAGGFKCMITNCPTKQQLESIKEEIRIYKDTIAKQGGQIKAFQDKSKVILGAEDAAKIYKESLESMDLKAKEFEIIDIEREKALWQDRYEEKTKQFDTYVSEQEDIKSNWEMDLEAQEKIKKIKDMNKMIKKLETETSRLNGLVDNKKSFLGESEGYDDKLKETIKANQKLYKEMIMRNAELKVENDRLDAELASKRRRLFRGLNIFRKDKDLQKAHKDILEGGKIDVGD